jgi:methyltransferase (TIGR00027 family)
VSDTARWVAACRAIESERPDALFRDPLADRLAGRRGREMAHGMPDAKQTIWSIAIRTVVVDEFVSSAIADGVDTILDLGAGLDTRPYRLDLPRSLRWVEVDYPKLVEAKDDLLRDEVPACRVERMGLDLADRAPRQALFERLGAASRSALVLTEGVIPYLSQEDASRLAADLHEQPAFARWVTDYFSPVLIRYQRGRRSLRNAPFLFDPPDWEAFFAEQGWRLEEMRYLGEESDRRHRRVPTPWFVGLMAPFPSSARRHEMRRMTGYALLGRKD